MVVFARSHGVEKVIDFLRDGDPEIVYRDTNTLLRRVNERCTFTDVSQAEMT